jgi:hypothetical protein
MEVLVEGGMSFFMIFCLGGIWFRPDGCDLGCEHESWSSLCS